MCYLWRFLNFDELQYVNGKLLFHLGVILCSNGDLKPSKFKTFKKSFYSFNWSWKWEDGLQKFWISLVSGWSGLRSWWQPCLVTETFAVGTVKLTAFVVPCDLVIDFGSIVLNWSRILEGMANRYRNRAAAVQLHMILSFEFTDVDWCRHIPYYAGCIVWNVFAVSTVLSFLIVPSSHCGCTLAVKHVLLECDYYYTTRHWKQRFFNAPTLKELFGMANTLDILGFITNVSGISSHN